MSRKTPWLIGLLISLVATSALALDARDTADVKDKGEWSVGVFNPLSLSPQEGVELELHPLLFFSAPHLQARFDHGEVGSDGWRVSSLVGLWFPYPALTSGPPLGLVGFFVPTCKVAEAEPDSPQGEWCQAPGWMVVPRLGLAASRGDVNVLTLKADVAGSLMLEGERPAPLDTYAPLDLQLAPLFNRWRAHASVRYDYLLRPGMRASVEGHVYRVGKTTLASQSPWAAASHLGLDIALSATSRVSVGLYYWNTDQRAVSVEKDSQGFGEVKQVRSHDVMPTIDFIWEGGG